MNGTLPVNTGTVGKRLTGYARGSALLRVLALALLLGTALAAIGAPRLEAEAAGAGAVKVCVTFQSGDLYRWKPVQLISPDIDPRFGGTNADGCGTFYNVPVGADFWVSASWTNGYGVTYYDDAPDSARFLELTYPGQLRIINLVVRAL